jgi:hypothetical protein
MEYLDFDVHLSQRAGDRYTIAVTHSPVGEAFATQQLPFDDAALERSLKGLEVALMRSGSVRRGVAMTDTDAATVSAFGRQLFGALFTGDVAVALRRSQDHVREKRKGLRLRLRIDDPQLAALPWEFAFDPERGDYVCLSMETPLVRYLDSGRPIETLAVQPPLTVLAMVASPSDRASLDVDAEIERVGRATASLVESGRLHVEWMQGAGWRDLQRTLRRGDYHVFHFIGHGGFDQTAGEGTLSFVGENGRSQTLNATEVGSLLADERALRLVVLNSCLGAKGDGASVFSSTAATLVRRGVPAVVAMQYEISDRAALEFSQSLYEAIADGMPVDAAVSEARKAVRLSARDSVEWGTPVLHMRSPDGVLFRVDTTATRRAVTATPQALRTVAAPSTTPVPSTSATPPAVARPLLGAQERPAPAAPTPTRSVTASPKSGVGMKIGIGLGAVVASIIAIVQFRPSADSEPIAPSLAPAPALDSATNTAPDTASGTVPASGPLPVRPVTPNPPADADSRTTPVGTPTLRVESISPVDGASALPIQSVFTISFSEDVDPSSVTASSLVLTAQGAPLAASRIVSGRTITVRPSALLPERSTVQLGLRTGITSVAGNSLSTNSDATYQIVPFDPRYFYRFFNGGSRSQSLDTYSDAFTGFMGQTGEYGGQFWYVTEIDGSPGTYLMRNAFKGDDWYLESTEGTGPVVLQRTAPKVFSGQMWKFTANSSGPGCLSLQSVFLGAGKSLENVNGVVQMQPTASRISQCWIAQRVGPRP